MLQKVDIVGLGALGTMYAQFFAGKLGRENVRVLVDEERRERYTKDGVRFNGELCDFEYLVPKQDDTPAELLIFAVKYGALPDAMELAAPVVGENTVIVSVLNGIRSEQDLAARFGAEKVLFCTAQKMSAVRENGNVVCPFIGEWTLGSSAASAARLPLLTELLDRTGFSYNLPADVQKALWGKLICNVGVNQAVACCEGTYSSVQAPCEARREMIAAMRECAAVGRAEGVDLTDADVEYWLAVIDGLNPAGEPSMRQDAKAGRPTEVELFAGTVCALGRKHGIPTPANDRYYSVLKK